MFKVNVLFATTLNCQKRMLSRDTAKAKHLLNRLASNQIVALDWISPVVSTVLASQFASLGNASLIRFSPNALDYATTINLKPLLDGLYDPGVSSGRQGYSYTKLTRITNHSDVNNCNKVISDLIHAQFGTFSKKAVSLLVKVVGELHDNVASHSRSVGYSSAQVYKYDGNQVIFSVSDSGVGMLSNMKKVDSFCQSETEALKWCLKKGNTTARSGGTNEWAQRLPEDSIFSPFPDSTPVFSEENHHAGHGLWQLLRLVQEFNGNLWILSGRDGNCAEYLYSDQKEKYNYVNLPWDGVSVSFSLKIPPAKAASGEKEEALEELGRRLGL